ncbi:hypothetical protein Godav_016974 [Gossypium davidsonii]|uniref:Uncharacterized protein n=1 Tax=Gossypium davidsonii TaxID=34287 RepID=A0A7J8QRU1_GOSDV|nr:hypothetical protein [Gossypium davidsonii]
METAFQGLSIQEAELVIGSDEALEDNISEHKAGFIFDLVYHSVDLRRMISVGSWSFYNCILLIHQLSKGENPKMRYSWGEKYGANLTGMLFGSAGQSSEKASPPYWSAENQLEISAAIEISAVGIFNIQKYPYSSASNI